MFILKFEDDLFRLTVQAHEANEHEKYQFLKMQIYRNINSDSAYENVYVKLVNLTLTKTPRDSLSNLSYGERPLMPYQFPVSNFHLTVKALTPLSVHIQKQKDADISTFFF